MKKTEIKRVPVFWRDHDSDHVRIWRGDWFGDQFEVIPRDQFLLFENLADRLGVATIKQASDD
jgi:hypothetical protein